MKILFFVLFRRVWEAIQELHREIELYTPKDRRFICSKALCLSPSLRVFIRLEATCGNPLRICSLSVKSTQAWNNHFPLGQVLVCLTNSSVGLWPLERPIKPYGYGIPGNIWPVKAIFFWHVFQNFLVWPWKQNFVPVFIGWSRSIHGIDTQSLPIILRCSK